MWALDVCSEPLGPQFSVDDRGRHAIVIIAAEVQGVIDLRALLRVGNIDATIYAESPRLGPYRIAMQHNLAGALGTKTHDVNTKFKTLEVSFQEFSRSRQTSEVVVQKLEAF